MPQEPPRAQPAAVRHFPPARRRSPAAAALENLALRRSPPTPDPRPPFATVMPHAVAAGTRGRPPPPPLLPLAVPEPQRLAATADRTDRESSSRRSSSERATGPGVEEVWEGSSSSSSSSSASSSTDEINDFFAEVALGRWIEATGPGAESTAAGAEASSAFLETIDRCLAAGADPLRPFQVSAEDLVGYREVLGLDDNDTDAIDETLDGSSVSAEASSWGSWQSRFEAGFSTTPLHLLLEAHCTAGVRRCVRGAAHRRPLNFAQDEEWRQETVLHTICRCCGHPTDNPRSMDVAREMFEIVAQRLAQRRPGEAFAWGQVDIFGDDVFTCAARHGLLHVLWEAVKPLIPLAASIVGPPERLPVQGSHAAVKAPPSPPLGGACRVPIPLLSVVTDADWERLCSAGEDNFFTCSHGVTDAATASLVWLVCVRPRLYHRWGRRKGVESAGMLRCVRRGVAAGARISFRAGGMAMSPLHAAIQHELVECLRIFLFHGAPLDFTVRDAGLEQTPLHYLMHHRHPEALQTMLRLVVMRLSLSAVAPSTPSAAPSHIVVTSWDNGVLRQQASGRGSSDPADRLDWQQRDADGLDPLSLAASHQTLHLVWPLVRLLPAFAPSTARSPQRAARSRAAAAAVGATLGPKVPRLLAVVSEEDWALLGAEGRAGLHPACGVADCATVALLRLSASVVPPSLDAVRRCVLAGADVTYTHGGSGWRSRSSTPSPQSSLRSPQRPPEEMSQKRVRWAAGAGPDDAPVLSSLHRFILRELVDCVSVCMLSPKRIDFTVTDLAAGPEGMTPLHYICMAHTPKMAAALLEPVVQRLQQRSRNPASEADVVDWRQMDQFGDDFLSAAARREVVHAVWPLLQSLPPFAAATEAMDAAAGSGSRTGDYDRLRLTQPLSDTDWALLAQAGQAHCFFRNPHGEA
eukprot:gene11318-7850_t